VQSLKELPTLKCRYAAKKCVDTHGCNVWTGKPDIRRIEDAPTNCDALMKAKLLILIPVILITAVAGIVWVAVSGWPPIIIRNREYRELLNHFQQAQLREQKRGDRNVLWDFQIDVPERQTTARVWAPAYPGTATIKYIGEGDEHRLYKYVDYSGVREIRTAGNILYVYWIDGVFRPDNWLLAYDLAGRREIARRKIDPRDLVQSH
jgi:hypothetical protein